MLSAVSLICPSEIKKFRNVSLSRTTIQQKIEDITNNITEQLRQKAKFSYYSLAIDEITNSTDTAQVLVFVRSIDDNFRHLRSLLVCSLCKVKLLEKTSAALL